MYPFYSFQWQTFVTHTDSQTSVNKLIVMVYIVNNSGCISSMTTRRLGAQNPCPALCFASHFPNTLQPSGHSTYVNILKLRILPIECVCVFRTILTISSDCFNKQHSPVYILREDVMYCPQDWERIFRCRIGGILSLYSAKVRT
jgi:hypothetical protein